MSHNSNIMYRPQIDGLRAIAVIPVMFYHFGMFQQFTSGGFAGVDVFFVISGFLVNSIIISDIVKEQFSYVVFYQRRIRRLFPAIFVLLLTLLSICFVLYFQKKMYQQLVQETKYSLLSVVNIHYYLKTDPNDDGYWGDQSKQWPLLHFWSLAVEQQFYMITPLLLKVISKLSKSSLFLLSAGICYCVLIIISLALSIIYTQTFPMFAFYLIICRAWQLGFGALLAVILHQKSIRVIQEKIKLILKRNSVFQKQIFNKIILEIISWFGLFMIFWSYIFFNGQNDSFPGYKALIPCIGTVLVIGGTLVRFQQTKNNFCILQKKQIVESQNQHLKLLSQSQRKIETSSNHSKLQQLNKKRITTSLSQILSFKPLVWIGKISFSLYLWHWPIWILNNYCMPIGNQEKSQLNKYFILFLTFIIANSSTQWIQNPVRNKKIVKTTLLWWGFAFCWIGTVFYLQLASKLQVGGYENLKQFELQKKIKTDLNQFLYPLQDTEGTPIFNFYMDYNINLINFEKIENNPRDTSNKFNSKRNAKRGIPFSSYFVNMKEKQTKQQIFDLACVMALGSSKVVQFSEILQELALQHNISLMITAQTGKSLEYHQHKDRQLYEWRMKQIQTYKPKIIFFSQYWKFLSSRKSDSKTTQDIVRSILDSLLNSLSPPQLIVFFSDIPQIQIKFYRKEGKQFSQVLKQLYVTQGKYSWQFLNNIPIVKLDEQLMIQKQIQRVIQENYDTKIVKFYPHLHQFMQNPYTGKFQFFGSQVNGQYLYYDSHHVSIHGQKRFKNYLYQKIFKKAKKICKSQS